MNYKTSYTISSSPSAGRKRLQPMKMADKTSDVLENIRQASDKLTPIIESVVEDSKYLTAQQFEDVKMASKLTKKVVVALPFFQTKKYLQNITFDLDTFHVTTDNIGHIYVDTALLLQLIDLYNVLEEIKIYVNRSFEFNKTNTLVETESCNSAESDNSLDPNPNKIIVKMVRPLDTSENYLSNMNDFIILPSLTEIFDNPSQETEDEPDAGQSKSSGSMKEEVYQVTDVDGAKTIIAKCICDLEKVNLYLSKQRKDVATIHSKTDLEQTSTFTKSRRSANRPDLSFNIPEEKCCCSDTCLENLKDDSQNDIDGCDEGKVLICIKGRTKEEGDIHIVVRQCPDCKKIKELSESGIDQSLDMRYSRKEPTVASDIISELDTSSSPSAVQQLAAKEVKETKPVELLTKEPSIRDFNDATSNETESLSLHDKGYQENSGEEPKPDIPVDVILSPKDLAEPKPESIGPSAPQAEVKKMQQEITDEDYSKIQLYETTNLCLQTEGGEELVISLKVTPKINTDNERPKSILEDLFGEDDDTAITKASNSLSDILQDENNITLDTDQPEDKNERVIPLMRTKICSSLDFDVTVADTKIRSGNIRHQNTALVVKLKEVGVNNLLRACRPAKCCRKAILNEKMKKCLPYPPSLRSLPLDNEDVSIINESLQMSLQKVKNSIDLKKDYHDNKTVFCLTSKFALQTIMYCFVSNVRKFVHVREKLKYYINLAHDDCEYQYPLIHYNLMYFIVRNANGNVSPDVRNRETQRFGDNEVLKIEPQNLVWNNTHRDSSSLKLLNNNVLKWPKINREPWNTNGMHHMNKFAEECIQSEPIPKTRNLKKILPSRIPVYRKTNQRSTNQNISKKNVNDNARFVLTKTEGHNYDSSSLNASGDLVEKHINKLLSSAGSLTNSLITTKGTLKRSRRKKSEFYYSRSKSEISLHTIYKKLSGTIIENASAMISNTSSANEIETSYGKDFEIKATTRVIADHFSKILYKLITRELTKSRKMFNKIGQPLSIPIQASDDKPIPIPKNRAKNIGVQTSDDLLNQTRHNQPFKIGRKTDLQPKKFERTFNEKALMNISNSCDEMENFVVVFQNESSIISAYSKAGFFSNHSSITSLKPLRKDTSSSSLIRVKQILEEYENIPQQSRSRIGPDKYLVYNNNYFKPSMFQKMLGKTKEIFSSTCNDTGIYNQDKRLNCRKCGCYLSNCPNADSEYSCSCPAHTKKPPHSKIQPQIQPVKRKVQSKDKKSWYDLTKFKSPSVSSFQKVKSRLSSIHKKNKGQEVHLCGCVPPSLKMAMAQHKSTQKCECSKCDAFAEDGTCCCSHCSGCLDKSSVAKPGSVEIGILCNCPLFTSTKDRDGFLVVDENEDITEIPTNNEFAANIL